MDSIPTYLVHIYLKDGSVLTYERSTRAGVMAMLDKHRANAKEGGLNVYERLSNLTKLQGSIGPRMMGV